MFLVDLFIVNGLLGPLYAAAMAIEQKWFIVLGVAGSFPAAWWLCYC